MSGEGASGAVGGGGLVGDLRWTASLDLGFEVGVVKSLDRGAV